MQLRGIDVDDLASGVLGQTLTAVADVDGDLVARRAGSVLAIGEGAAQELGNEGVVTEPLAGVLVQLLACLTEQRTRGRRQLEGHRRDDLGRVRRVVGVITGNMASDQPLDLARRAARHSLQPCQLVVRRHHACQFADRGAADDARGQRRPCPR